jgi:hypothetical protein
LAPLAGDVGGDAPGGGYRRNGIEDDLLAELLLAVPLLFPLPLVADDDGACRLLSSEALPALNRPVPNETMPALSPKATSTAKMIGGKKATQFNVMAVTRFLAAQQPIMSPTNAMGIAASVPHPKNMRPPNAANTARPANRIDTVAALFELDAAAVAAPRAASGSSTTGTRSFWPGNSTRALHFGHRADLPAARSGAVRT